MAHKLIRPATAGIAGAAAVLAAAAAGPASADVSAPYINVVGSTFQTGQTYTVQVTVPAGASAIVWDSTNSGQYTVNLGTAVAAAGSTVATLQWTPNTPGTNAIWATVISTSVSTGTAEVPVTGTATSSGSTTLAGNNALDSLPIIGPILKSLGL